MASPVALGVSVFGSLLAVIDPIAAVPAILGISQGMSAMVRREMLTRSVLAAAAGLLLTAVAGTHVLKMFGLTPLAFRVAGAALFAGMGWEMLHAQTSAVSYTASELRDTQEHTVPGTQEERARQLALIPIAMPLLAGPGALSTVIAQMGQAKGLADQGAVYLAIAMACLVTWGVLVTGVRLERRLGQTGLNVVTRLAGLLLLTMSAQWAIDSWVAIQQLRG